MMKRKYKLLSLPLIISVLLISGCMTMQSSQTNNINMNVVNKQLIHLPKPSKLNMNLMATQILNAHYKKRSLVAQVQVEINSKKIALVALGGWGGEVFSIDYDGTTIRSHHLSLPHANIAVQNVLRDFLLTYLPISKLKDQLVTSDIKLHISAKQRIFTLYNKPIIKINYSNINPWVGTVVLHNLAAGYTIKITTISYKKIQ